MEEETIVKEPEQDAAQGSGDATKEEDSAGKDKVETPTLDSKVEEAESSECVAGDSAGGVSESVSSEGDKRIDEAETKQEPVAMDVDPEEKGSSVEENKLSDEMETVEITEEGEGPAAGPDDQSTGIVEDPDESKEVSPAEPEGVEFVELDPSGETEQSVDPTPPSNSEEESLGESDFPDLERIEAAEDAPDEAAINEPDAVGVSEGDAAIDETDQEEVEVDLVELLTKKDVFLYEIPMEDKSKSRKASEWNLSEPLWCGNLQLLSQGAKCVIKLEDEQETMYGYAVVESYPCEDFRPVTDSTRYFVIKYTKDNSDANEPDTDEVVGMGFSDRKDSADFIWTLLSHFKGEDEPSTSESQPKQTEAKQPTVYLQLPEDKPSTGHAQGKKRKSSNGDNASGEPAKKVMFKDQVPTSSSHIVIEEGDVEKYVKQGLKRPGLFPCHLCPASFDDMRHIKTHWHQVHKLRYPAHCVDCHRPFPTKEKMVEHRDEVHGYKCPKCARAFRLDRILEAHFMSEHLEKLEYRCSLCEEKYENRASLKSHLEEVHPTSLVKCPECPETKLFTVAELAAHTGAHDKYLFCHLCDAGFSTKGQLRNHTEATHVGAEPLKLL